MAFTGYSTGSVVIDTSARTLYYVTSSTSAYRYPISVGREGFAWRGVERISRVASWPDWRPPAEMRKRDPNLPEVMSGAMSPKQALDAAAAAYAKAAAEKGFIK